MLILIYIAFFSNSFCNGIFLRGEDNVPLDAKQVHTTQNGVFTDQRDANPTSNVNDIIHDIKTFEEEVNVWLIENALQEKMNEIEPDSVERKEDVSKEEKEEEFVQAVDSLLSNDNVEDILQRRKKKSCRSSGECGNSLRCAYHWNDRTGAGGGTCISRLGNGSWCQNGEDCASGYCGWDYKCSQKITCQEDSDCKSRRCEHHATLNERVCTDLGNNGEYCEQDQDCKSKFCDPKDKKCHAKRYKSQKCSSDDDCGGLMTCSRQTNTCLSFPRKKSESCEPGKKMCARGLECQEKRSDDDDSDEDELDNIFDENGETFDYFLSMFTINTTNSSDDNITQIEEYVCEKSFQIKKAGDVCTEDHDCYSSLTCEDGICVKPEDWGNVGDVCDHEDDCQTRLTCNDIGECEVPTVATNITYTAEKGDKCDKRKFTFCKSPLICHVSKKQCVYASKEQEEEAHTCYNSECDYGFKCVENECVQKDIGDKCRKDYECKESLYCDSYDKECTEQKDVGDDCLKNSECKDFLFCHWESYTCTEPIDAY